MNSNRTSLQQIPLHRQVFNHFYIGVLITLFYIIVGPLLIGQGYPSLTALLLAEIAVLAPIGLWHLSHEGKKLNGHYSLINIIGFREPLPFKTFLMWYVGGMMAILLVYVPFYPVGQLMRSTAFAWLPEWYFNPTFGTDNLALVAKVFLVGIIIDGLIGPTIEELFFRGYLLPRMAYLKNWAPVLNGAMFGLYHFWQPHNLLAIIPVGIILSFVVWKTKNVYLGIAIHCTLNVLGSIGGYLAVSNGVMIGR